MSRRRKVATVMPLLRSEDLETVPRELGVTAATVSGWREDFLAGGEAALTSPPNDDRDLKVDQLISKLGKLTLDQELRSRRSRGWCPAAPMAWFVSRVCGAPRGPLNQMIVAIIMDQDGRPVCSELWPGNTADVTALIPVVDRLRQRFGIGRVCVVADPHLREDGKRFILRTSVCGIAGKLFQAVGVALPPNIQDADEAMPAS